MIIQFWTGLLSPGILLCSCSLFYPFTAISASVFTAQSGTLSELTMRRVGNRVQTRSTAANGHQPGKHEYPELKRGSSCFD
ncbi:hypothetical protein R1flu_015347 [Riccia fluitans]|uniref:Secreted protein n=1 Tax=Riccia fluitans TaxID=41844 RepID=A0ABD1YIN8_9MARC